MRLELGEELVCMMLRSLYVMLLPYRHSHAMYAIASAVCLYAYPSLSNMYMPASLYTVKTCINSCIFMSSVYNI